MTTMDLLALIGGAAAIMTVCTVIGVLIVRAVDAFINIITVKSLLEQLMNSYEDIVERLKDLFDD